jgi:hypothetical protein
VVDAPGGPVSLGSWPCSASQRTIGAHGIFVGLATRTATARRCRSAHLASRISKDRLNLPSRPPARRMGLAAVAVIIGTLTRGQAN